MILLNEKANMILTFYMAMSLESLQYDSESSVSIW
jgi:hypothetical protein